MNKKIVVTIWFLLVIFIYGWTELTAIQNKNFEASIAFIIYMCILTFPIGLVVPVFWMLIALLLSGTKIGVILENGHLTNFLLWISFVVLGYWQWFILLPKVIQKIRSKRKESQLSK